MELLTFAGIFQRLVVSLLSETHRLGGDAETGAVHQGHDIFDQTHAGITAELSLGVLEDQLAGRRAMDAQLVFDVTYGNTAIALVVNEHRKSTTVPGTFLGTGQHQMDMGVTVGDETLHSVE